MKWIRTMVCALGMLACVSLSAFAAEYGEPNITTETTMKELRENPSIKGSGYYTYCNEWIEGSTQYDDTPIEGYVSYAARRGCRRRHEPCDRKLQQGRTDHMAGVYPGRNCGKSFSGHGAVVLFPG